MGAKDDHLKEPIFDEVALRTVKQCVDRKVKGTDFYQALSEHWNWEWEPAMIPFSAKDGVGPSESVGYMVELTSPGPPKGTSVGEVTGYRHGPPRYYAVN